MNVLKLRRTTWMVAVGVLVTAGTLVVADMAWSQPNGSRRGWMGRRGPGGPGGLARPGGRGGPGGVLTVPRGQLGLSEEQRDAVRGVLEEGREALREAGEQARASRQALRDAVGTGGDVDEDAIRAAAAGLGTARGAMALARASARARIWEVLTPDQRTAADVLRTAREQRMEARRERWKERRERWEERRDQPRGRGRGEGRRGRGEGRRGRGEGRRGRGEGRRGRGEGRRGRGEGRRGRGEGLAARNRRLRPSGFERGSPFGGCAIVVCPEALGRRRGHWPEREAVSTRYLEPDPILPRSNAARHHAASPAVDAAVAEPLARQHEKGPHGHLKRDPLSTRNSDPLAMIDGARHGRLVDQARRTRR